MAGYLLRAAGDASHCPIYTMLTLSILEKSRLPTGGIKLVGRVERRLQTAIRTKPKGQSLPAALSMQDKETLKRLRARAIPIRQGDWPAAFPT
jgi:hypothetical protein